MATAAQRVAWSDGTTSRLHDDYDSKSSIRV